MLNKVEKDVSHEDHDQRCPQSHSLEGEDSTPVRSALYEPVAVSAEPRLSHRSDILDRDEYLRAITTMTIPSG
jgi:hypothetical protein